MVIERSFSKRVMKLYYSLSINNFNMEVEPMLGENPETFLENNNLTTTAHKRKQQKYTNKNSLFEQCQIILNKPYESRAPAENSTLLKMLQKSTFLSELSENVSLDFLKGIFRNAKIEIIDQKQVIADQGQSLNYMVVVLDGQLGVQKPLFFIPSEKGERSKGKQTIQIQGLQYDQIFQKLTMTAKEERQVIKARSKVQRKSSLPVSSYDFQLPVLGNDQYEKFTQNIERTISANEQYGARQRLRSATSKSRVAAMKKTILLVVQMSFLFYWLEAAFKSKLATNIELMKKIPCFSTIEDEKLSQVILSMKKCLRKKKDTIYYQGDNAQCFYILLKGQVKLIKNANLFQQNPNDFYVNRKKLVAQMYEGDKTGKRRNLKGDEEILPFANFTTLYNYRPIKKMVEIGVISSFGLFGEQQIVYNTARQTSAVVDSLHAVYFQIEYKRVLEIVTPKHADKFRKALEGSVSKKILYRQHELAEHIDLQNRTHMDYFYLDNGKQKQSPRKFKLEKINSKMSPKKVQNSEDHISPLYTTFNFNKMFSNRRYPSTSTPKYEVNKTNESSNESLMNLTLDHNEQRLIGISHSWNPIQRKVKQEGLMSKRLSPQKQKIDIQAPLIDQKYFRDMAKEKQRISKDYRIFRLSLGKKGRQK